MDSRTNTDQIRSVNPALIGTVVLIGLCLGANSSNPSQEPPPSPFNAHVGPGDWPQLGGTPVRNNTPNGVNIPTDWDIHTGNNIKWSAKLGSESYGTVVVAKASGRKFFTKVVAEFARIQLFSKRSEFLRIQLR